MRARPNITRFKAFARRSQPSIVSTAPPTAGGAGSPEPTQQPAVGSGCPTCKGTGLISRPCRHLNCAANHPRPCPTCDPITQAVHQLFA